MNWNQRDPKGRAGERGIALLVAVLLLVGLTALSLSTLSSSGIDYAAARANAGTLGRASCMDQVARYIIEQYRIADVQKAVDDINNGSCSNSAVAWVNFPIPAGTMGCIQPEPACGPGGADVMNFTYPACPDTRAIALTAPTAYTPGGTLVGTSIGEGSSSDERRVGMRVIVADMSNCDIRYLNQFLDVALVETYRTSAGSGDIVQ